MKIQELGKILMTLKDKADSVIKIQTPDGTTLDIEGAVIEIDLVAGDVVHTIKLKAS